MIDDFSEDFKEEKYRPWYFRKSFLVTGILICFFIWFVPWAPLLLYSGSIEVTRLDAKGKPIVTEVGPSTKQWVSIKGVSRHLLNAIVVSEDSKFYSHNGFDFEAIHKAYELNRKKGKFVRGGSTISQQVVKMAFLSREKTYTRKLREALGTAFMELLLPKDKILEWYINLTEFGGGIYGVKQAGQYYFRTRPELLTTEQAIHLAVVIPSPNKWSKGLRSKNLTPFGQRRFLRIANNLRRGGFISDAQRDTVLVRGNFGRPIEGYKAAAPIDVADDEDDCKDAKDCMDDESPSKNLLPTASLQPTQIENKPIELPSPANGSSLEQPINSQINKETPKP